MMPRRRTAKQLPANPRGDAAHARDDGFRRGADFAPPGNRRPAEEL